MSSMASLPPEQLLEQLRALNSNPSAIASLPSDVRLGLQAASRELGHKLETPFDTLARLLLCQPVEGASVRIATDLKLFTILADGAQHKDVEYLASATKADPVFLLRLLRSLEAIHAVEQTEPGHYVLSPAYKLLAEPSMAQSWAPCVDFLGEVYKALPPFLAESKYHNPTNPLDTVAQKAFNSPDTPYMEILYRYPEALQSFVTLMKIWADGFNTIQSLYPVQEKLIEGFDKSVGEVMFLDIGGGMGQKAISFNRAFPEQPGHVVVQDLAALMDNIPKTDPSYEGVDMTVHDFFTEQPVKNARCYYLRQCLHNWTDEVSVDILKRQREAMKGGYSKLLIHEIIVPERGAGTWVTAQDFEMMGMFATLERTENQWRSLCERAGLRVVGVYLDGHPSCEGIIEAEI